MIAKLYQQTVVLETNSYLYVAKRFLNGHEHSCLIKDGMLCVWYIPGVHKLVRQKSYGNEHAILCSIYDLHVVTYETII